ncbi:MAG: hypothetical protein M1820_004063 [Bogoriella megaspora]|nr:MAG: hypothetical protein M1820_004063 [Bogoriella megaspora]
MHVNDEAEAWLKLSIEMDDLGESIDPNVGVDEDPGLWYFVLLPQDEVSNNIGDHKIVPVNYEEDTFLSIARQWFQSCKAQHSECHLPSAKHYLPTRLLDIRSVDSKGEVYLNLSDESHIAEPYATLSHCWGKARTLKLTSTNIGMLQSGIKVNSLSTSYKEGITVARRLGLHYVWIDSLCIIQDSDTDWRREAAQMANIFRNSEINIATAAAADNSDPCFTERNLDLIRLPKLKVSWAELRPREYFLLPGGLYFDQMQNSPLQKRAWVLQETILAPRILWLCKSQFWWTCTEFQACESFPNGVPDRGISGQGVMSSLSMIRGSRTERLWSWNTLMERYSRHGITVLSDRTIALSGIAQDMEEKLNDRYIAGMWMSQLPRHLAWSTTGGTDVQFRPDKYRAPSWSWLSIEGPIRFNNLSEHYLHLHDICRLVDVQLQFRDNNRYGLIDGGYVKLRGPLGRITPNFKESKVMVEGHGGSFDFLERLPVGDGNPESDSDTDLPDDPNRIEFDNSRYDSEDMMVFDYFSAETIPGSPEWKFQNARQVHLKEADPTVSLYLFPIFAFTLSDDKQTERCTGLLLLRERIGQREVFHRVGIFDSTRTSTTSRLKALAESEITIV